LLCKALEATRIAGIPNEWLYRWLDDQNGRDPAELQTLLWKRGSTPNGVFGLKHSFHEPHFGRLIETLRQFPGCPPDEQNRVRIWEQALPNHKHIFMTRRNKVRLAVSWWKAIKSQEWHRLADAPARGSDLQDAFSFEAIYHLFQECSMREAGIQELFSEGQIVPLTLVYEDFIAEYERTVRSVLEFLELDTRDLQISAPPLAPTADATSEVWVQRFREELQSGWQNRGW
jgi:LPS sulfotransferase NodH